MPPPVSIIIGERSTVYRSFHHWDILSFLTSPTGIVFKSCNTLVARTVISEMDIQRLIDAVDHESTRISKSVQSISAARRWPDSLPSLVALFSIAKYLIRCSFTRTFDQLSDLPAHLPSQPVGFASVGRRCNVWSCLCFPVWEHLQETVAILRHTVYGCSSDVSFHKWSPIDNMSVTAWLSIIR